MAKTGLSYYQAETDRFQDIKVKRLKKRYGCEGYAVYQYIQNEIYRVEGCYIRFTDDQLFDVSEYWGIEEQQVEKIIEYCTEVELFDTITWHTNHVLTSVDIQQRYLEICRRAKKKIVIPEDIRLVEIQDATSGMDSAPLPLFSGQEIETKTGKTVYGSPKLDTGKQTVTTAGISSGAIIPQSSAEIPETPRNSAEKRHKEKESKENSPSIPRTIPPARDDEDKVSLSPDGNRGNVSAESCGKRPERSDEYRLKLQRLGKICYDLGCSKGDIREVLLLEDIAQNDSPIWQLIEELKASGGRYSFTGDVLPALRGLVKTGRLRMMEERTDEVKEDVHNVRQMLSGIGVPSYDMDELCEEAKGKEDVLQEVIREIRRSKGRILSVSCFIRSRLKKAKKNELQKTA
ncbi:DUF4373 domain-containing protein [Bacteroides congonensis]